MFFTTCLMFFSRPQIVPPNSPDVQEKFPGKFPEKPQTQCAVTCFWEEIRKRRDREKSNLSQHWN